VKDAIIIIAVLAATYAGISWASAPATVSIERNRANTLQSHVEAQATTIMRLQPTPGACLKPYPLC